MIKETIWNAGCTFWGLDLEKKITAMLKKYMKSKIFVFVAFLMTFNARKTNNLGAKILVQPISTNYWTYYYESSECKSKVLLSFIFRSKEHKLARIPFLPSLL